MCGNSNPPGYFLTAALSVWSIILDRKHHFYSVVHTLKEQNSFLENIPVLLHDVHLEGGGGEMRRDIQYCLSHQIAVGIGAASQVLNNTLDQGQINERVLLSNRI